MPRWVVVCALAAMAILPCRAMAADCAVPGVPGQYDVFVGGTFTSDTGGATIEGRVAAGGDARVQSIALGTNPPLAPDPSRADLVVGRDLTIGGGGGTVSQGRVTYGGTLTANGTLSTLGGLHHEQPPFDFSDQMALVRERSAQWADLKANGTITGPGSYDIRFNGTSSTLNVFALTASALQSYGKVTINVPSGSTTLVNVSGSTFTSALYGIDLVGTTPDKVVWNFPLATSVQQTSGLDFKGTILAPNAGVNVANGHLYGQILGAMANIGSYGLFHTPFTGCLPPQPTKDLALASLCTDPVTNHHALRVRNTGDSDHPVTWSDNDSAQTGAFTAGAGTDTFFDVLGGDTVHHIVVRSGSTTLEQATSTRRCAGTITLSKVVTGVAPPAGPWRIEIAGDNGFTATRDLGNAQQSTVAVPGSYQAGQVPIGEVAGGARYAISETDPLGALVSIDKPLVTILDGQRERVTVRNAFSDVTPPDPVPPQPPQPPGPPQPLPGPDLVVAASVAEGADLAITESISPRVVTVGGLVSVTIHVRNKGPQPAVNALAREIPQFDPAHPNQIARILGVKAGTRVAGCTSQRPVSCGATTLPAGADVVIRVRARMLVGGIFESVVVTSSQTPDPNTANNVAATGLVVRRPANVAVAVRAPALARVGAPVAYRVIARGAGSDGARSVRFCHRPPARLLMTSAPGTFRWRGQVCRDVSRLARGQQTSFVVHAIPAASAGGRTLALRATATAPDARPAVAGDRIAVVAQTFAGSG
ncbi:MAG TPA: choice-of-anchor A family protein [Solirubrobacteraceae bacterium]